MSFLALNSLLTQAALELGILLSQLPKCWDSNRMLTHLGNIQILIDKPEPK
jgi:hypothetical protein